MSPPNIIFFGESGAGKSSCVNMLEGDSDAKVSSRATGVTFTSICYEKAISGHSFRVFDTVGLDEPGQLVAKSQEVICALRGLIRQLEGGVCLLVYVMRAPRIKETAKQNYDMFFNGFCKRNVPIVIIITGLEDEENMDQWWEENKGNFEGYKMRFSGFACITATKGKFRDGEHRYEDEYNESKKKVKQLICEWRLDDPWKMPPESWLETVNGYVYSKIRSISGDPKKALHNITSRSAEAHGVSSIANVILFGESGVGKSSIINMVDGRQRAWVSDQAMGVTFSATSYNVTLFGLPFRLFDTAGLNEGSKGKVEAQSAIRNLYKLICQLQDGVHLLVFVMRAPRITETAQRNYKMFFEVFFQKRVPIVVVVTGLENKENMDEWWKENEGTFSQYEMKFKGHACTTAILGDRNGMPRFQGEYEESKKKVEQLIYGSCSRVGWKMDSKSWFNAIVDKVIRLLETSHGPQRKLLARALQDYGGMSKQEAKSEAKKIEDELTRKEGVTGSHN